jgi:hypothetical protein
LADINQTLVSRGTLGADLLDLNFAASGFGIEGVVHPTILSIPGMTFTRASGGYAEDSTGKLKWFGSGVPRITDKGYLAEAATTNLLTNTETLSGWYGGGATPLISGTIGPNGVAMPYIHEDSTTGGHYIYQVFTVTAATYYTVSFYAQALNRAKMYVQDGSVGSVIFDLSAGTIYQVTGTGVSGRITPCPFSAGLYRCEMTYPTAPGETSCTLQFGGYTTSTAYPGAGVNICFFAYPQMEVGYHASSYTPSSSAAATRDNDILYRNMRLPTYMTTFSEVVTPFIPSQEDAVTLRCVMGTEALYVPYFQSNFLAISDGINGFGQSATLTPGAIAKIAVTRDPSGKKLASSVGSLVSDQYTLTDRGSTLGIGVKPTWAYWFGGYIRRVRVRGGETPSWAASGAELTALVA